MQHNISKSSIPKANAIFRLNSTVNELNSKGKVLCKLKEKMLALLSCGGHLFLLACFFSPHLKSMSPTEWFDWDENDVNHISWPDLKQVLEDFGATCKAALSTR